MRTGPMHRKQTAAYINQNAIEVVLRRGKWEADGKGGTLKAPPLPLPSQVCRMVAIGLVRAVTERTTADGRVVVPSYVLVGMPEFDVEVGDIFTYDDRDYEVVNVSRLPEWRTQAEVVNHGQ